MKSKKILVTGGAGYIGSVLVKMLLDRGHQVRILDNLLYGSDAIIHLFPYQNLEFQMGDILSLRDLKRATKGVDAVVHLAAIVGDDGCDRDAKLATDTNVNAVRKIVRVMVERKVPRLVFASTCSVYGASENEILTEESKFNPVSHYARTKIEAEKIIFSEESKEFHPTVLRMSTIYGYSPRTRFDLVINLFAMRSAIYGSITIQGGHQWRPFVHVHDAARAFVKVLEAPVIKVSRQVFNVGTNNQNFRMVKFVEIIGKTLPGVKVNLNKSFTDLRSYHVSFDKIERVLHFKNERTVEDGLREIYKLIKSGYIPNPRDLKYIN